MPGSETTLTWIPAAGALIMGVVLAVIARVVVVGRLEAFLARTSNDLDDLALRAVRSHVSVWVLLGAVVVAARVSPWGDRISPIVTRVCLVGMIVSLTLAASGLGTALLARAARRSDAAVPMTSLAQNVLRIVVFSIGGLLALSNLGVSITPLLTALGVGSLAVALALQPTLSNLFAGVHLTVARPVRVGDFIELEGGRTGFVEDIGWRATRIRELPNNLVIVPNAKLAEMVLVNYALPEPEQAALVQLSVSYSSDLAHVERVTVDVAREVLSEIPGGVAAFEPFIRYHTFGESSIDFTVILRVRGFTDRYLVVHEFVKRVHARYGREGIEIPFPQRVLHGVPSMALASEERSQDAGRS